MKILLIVARQTRMGSYHLPVGIGYVSASLKRAGHEVRVLNPNHSTEELPDLLAAEIAAHPPDLVGTGGMAFHLNEIASIAAMTRKLLPQSRIVIGGPLVSNQPELAMTGIPEADFGVIGEGEQTTPELVAALEGDGDLSRVMGLIYRLPGAAGPLRRTSSRPIQNDLDSLPWVDYEGLGLDIYAGIHRPGECAPALIVDSNTRVMPLLTSRGCPYPCTFCCHEAAGRRYRTRSLDEVFAEIDAAVERFGINALFIYDDLFCLKRSRLVEFCERIKPRRLRWECSLSAGQVDPEILTLMKESGCCCISVGVESMSPRVLDSMKKKATTEELERVMGQIYAAGIGLWSNLIFGDPMETRETALESIYWWVDHNHYDIRVANIGYHPGSRIYDEALGRGLISDPLKFLTSGAPEINATTMSDAELEEVMGTIRDLLRSFGFHGKLRSVVRLESGLYDVDVVCPHCSAENHYEGLRPIQNMLHRVSCQRCNQLFRLPVVPRQPPTDELVQLVDELNSLVGEDPNVETNPHIPRIWELCWQIVKTDFTLEETWEVLVEVAGRICTSEEIVELLRDAIPCSPYCRSLFLTMAENLDAVGDPVEAARYRRQATLLDTHDITPHYLYDTA